MTREEAIKVLSSYDVNGVWADVDGKPYNAEEQAEAFDMAIEALSSDAIAKAYNQGFVEGSVNATVNSNYICPRCGEKMERKESGDTE